MFKSVKQKCSCGIYQYVCFNKHCQAHYISINMFYDVFGHKYAKPLYIEACSATEHLENQCDKKMLRGKCYYSLIKSADGTYRYNSEIYDNGRDILSLTPTHEMNCAYLLMNVTSEEIVEVLNPHECYKKAMLTNRQVAAAIKQLPHCLTSDDDRLGLIGSLGIDPMAEVRDIDIVFSGPASWLQRACDWIMQEDTAGPPLRRHLSDGLPTICSFFVAIPTAYPNLSNITLIHDVLTRFRVKILSALSPAYLNIQIYNIETHPKSDCSHLIVRDTLSRQALTEGMVLDIWGYEIRDKEYKAILMTDVEKQMTGAILHGGSTKCS